MAYTGRFGQSDDYRREELIRIIEHSVENLTLQEVEATLYQASDIIYSGTFSTNDKTGNVTLTSKLTEPKESHQGMITDVKAILK